MKTTVFQNEDEWLEARRGKITGSTLKDVVVLRGTEKKVGFYQLVADRIGVPPTDENRMDRGHRLETEAIDRFMLETGKKVNTDLVIWTRDDDENIALSPDGFIGTTEAVEVKCLNSATHIQALLTGEIPKEYRFQMLQYFIVNDKLKKLYFVFYDPRMARDFFYLEFKREDVQEDVDKYLQYERQILEEVEEVVHELTF